MMRGMNWQKIIQRLARKGYTLADLCRLCKAGHGTIHDLANGRTKEPRWGLGNRLLELLK